MKSYLLGSKALEFALGCCWKIGINNKIDKNVLFLFMSFLLHRSKRIAAHSAGNPSTFPDAVIVESLGQAPDG